MNATTKMRPANMRRLVLLMIFFISIILCARAQTNVTGTVSETNGEPIIGAIVKLKNGTLGTTTDIDGKYSISVPGNGVLIFSFLGFKSQEVAVQSRQIINVSLEEDAKSLDEVVVVGYSIIRKSSLTGALQTLDNNQLVDATTPSVENMLSGKSPGVFVSPGSGRPGDLAAITIRGKGTINGSTDPLWVIDGVIMGSEPYDINPSDIESLTVLKDAASTAMYGSQGANGVIQVVTKRAKMGKVAVNLSAKFAATRLDKGPFKVMNGASLYDYYDSFDNKEAFEASSWWNSDLRNRNFDWWDNAEQTGFAQDYNVSVSGGSEQLKSYVSVGYYDETAAVKGYDYTRYSVLMKVDYSPTKWLTLKPQLSGSRTDTDDQEHAVSSLYTNLPWDLPYKDDGTLQGIAPNAGWVAGTRSNYLYDLQWDYTKSKRHDLLGNFDFDIKITDWLTFASINSYKYNIYEEQGYTDPRSSGGLSVEGRITETDRRVQRLYTNQLLRINKSFGKHNLNAVLGYEWNEVAFKRVQTMATGIPPGFEVSEVASKPEHVQSIKVESASQSYFSNFNYAYDNRYLAQFLIRRDGASNFGRNAKYGTFFSVSGGWNIHNESFFKLDYVSQLKLRASYGSNGNRPDNSYPHQTSYLAGIKQGYDGHPGALINQIANPELGWEKSYITGIGADISFLDRFHLNLDYYYQNVTDLLYEVPIPGITGLTKVWRNEGEMQNKGFEVVVGAKIIDTQDLKWGVDANIGFNKNKVTKLYGVQDRMIVGDDSGIAGSASKIVTPGRDADTWYLKEWAGVNPDNGAPMWYKTDANGDRVPTEIYSEAKEVPIGTYSPDFFGGFSTNLTYKDFDLSAVFSYKVGGHIYNYSRTEYDSDGAYTDRNQMELHNGWNRWEKPGDIATHPKAIYGNKTKSNQVSSRFLETGTYLKLRNVTLGYNVPTKALGIAKLRVYASGENLFTISHFSGVDPEISPKNPDNKDSNRRRKTTGVATAMYPKTRKFVLGLNLTF